MTVIVDVDNQYCEELCHSYQICRDDDGSYFVWQETGVLKGRYLARGLETLNDAWDRLNVAMREYEYMEA